MAPRLQLLLLLAGAAAAAATGSERLVERPIAFTGKLGAELNKTVPIVDPPRRIAGYFKWVVSAAGWPNLGQEICIGLTA
jgi:hypothetical protein